MKSLIAIAAIASSLSADAHNLTIKSVTADTITVDSDLTWMGGNDTEAVWTPFGRVTAAGFVSSDGWVHNTFSRDGASITVSHHIHWLLPMIDGQVVFPGDPRLAWRYIIPRGRTYGFWRYTLTL